MNKARRHELKMLKYKKRIANYRVQGTNHNILRSTGKPCSCPMCSPGKVEEKAKYRHIGKELTAEEVHANRSSKYKFLDI